MSDIAALENRIAAAMERIRSGLAAAPSASAGGDLAGQLEEERIANAQLEERVRALKTAQDQTLAHMEERIAAQRAHMAQMEAELLRLRATHADLTSLTAHLRDAAATGAVDAELINRALLAEVEALTAARGAEAAEVTAILTELAPLLKEAENAAG